MKAKLNVKPIDIKVDEQTGNYVFTGYASTFLTQPDSYGDVIDRKAFDNTIKYWSEHKSPLPVLFNHDFDNVIGHYTKLETDDYGLRVEGIIVKDIQRGEEVVKLLQAGSFGSLSIGYTLNDYVDNQDGTYLLTDIDLKEISIVVMPANDLALIDQIKCKSANNQEIKLKEFERLLRDVTNCSRTESKKLLSELKARQRDVDVLEQISTKLDNIISNLKEQDNGSNRD